MLAGYDIFREAKIREFMSRQPDSLIRPKLFERVYPYLSRSPLQARGMATAFWKAGLDRAGMPGFSHEPRWSTTSAIKKFFSAEMKQSLASRPAPDVLDDLPVSFVSWDTLSQAQYLEIRTLLSGYLISSQGDRMLLGNSVEGRFPFLDISVMNFCNALPAEYKLIGLNEKYILKRVAEEVVPPAIIERKKQPYRAPDAISFTSGDVPEYVYDMFSEKKLTESGVFDVSSAQNLLSKSIERAKSGARECTYSNTDNMALVGILSTQLLFDQMIENSIGGSARDIEFSTMMDTVQDFSFTE
jgi:asparagine synthase (glutamine-hydrolysing)